MAGRCPIGSNGYPLSGRLFKLTGVPVVAGLPATTLFRFFTFWLPMAPGLILARRETRVTKNSCKSSRQSL